MPDKDLITISTLEDIKFSIELILKRFEKIDDSDAFLVDKLNNRPRKSLNWRTPNEVFYEKKEAA